MEHKEMTKNVIPDVINFGVVHHVSPEIRIFNASLTDCNDDGSEIIQKLTNGQQVFVNHGFLGTYELKQNGKCQIVNFGIIGNIVNIY